MFKKTNPRSELELELLLFNKVLALIPPDGVYGDQAQITAQLDMLRKAIESQLDTVLKTEEIVLAANERQHHLDLLIHDILGFGPLEPLIHDEAITEILVDRYDKIYVERHGKLEPLPHHFRDEKHLMKIIDRILAPLGKKADEENPIVDARLPDGSRVNVVVRPIAIHGSSLVIQMLPKRQLTFEELISFGSINQPIIDFLQVCIEGHLNIVISGSTASGKTTFFNLLTGFLPPDERIVMLENQSELQPPKHLERIVRLESRPANLEGRGLVSMRDLVINALRMRPDRLIIGEVLGEEALDVFTAMNTGHDGIMFSMHATGPRDALTRLEAMVYMAAPSLPLLQVRQQMSSALDLIVHADRLQDGKRKVTRISEVVGMKGDAIVLQDIFKFEETGMENGRITGNFTPTGYIPTFVKKIHAAGVTVPMRLFQKNEG